MNARPRRHQHARAAAPQPFGYLLTLDLYDCKVGACEDINLCYSYLEVLAGSLRMTMQSPPFVFRSDSARFPDKAGISGWVPLIESGIQIHTLTPKRFISVDVYSCRKFATPGVLTLSRQFFDPKAEEMNMILRGTKYHELT